MNNVELIEKVLDSRELHPSQKVEEVAKQKGRFLVLSVDETYHWIEGITETIEEALRLILQIEREWTLEGVYDLRAVLLGFPGTVEIEWGIRSPNHDVKVWEND